MMWYDDGVLIEERLNNDVVSCSNNKTPTKYHKIFCVTNQQTVIIKKISVEDFILSQLCNLMVRQPFNLPALSSMFNSDNARRPELHHLLRAAAPEAIAGRPARKVRTGCRIVVRPSAYA